MAEEYRRKLGSRNPEGVSPQERTIVLTAHRSPRHLEPIGVVEVGHALYPDIETQFLTNAVDQPLVSRTPGMPWWSQSRSTTKLVQLDTHRSKLLQAASTFEEAIRPELC